MGALLGFGMCSDPSPFIAAGGRALAKAESFSSAAIFIAEGIIVCAYWSAA